jgi:hypothetical protein
MEREIRTGKNAVLRILEGREISIVTLHSKVCCRVCVPTPALHELYVTVGLNLYLPTSKRLLVFDVLNMMIERGL